MIKIVITENQLKKILKENYSQTNYSVLCEVNVDYYSSEIENEFTLGEISDIEAKEKLEIFYNINLKHNQHGISGINLTDINGVNSINLNLSYYPKITKMVDNEIITDFNYDLVEKEIKINLDWKNVEIDSIYKDEISYLGIQPKLSIELGCDNNKFFVKKLIIYSNLYDIKNFISFED